MQNQNLFLVQEDRPLDWFEPLYASSNTNGEGVPWASMATHPSFANWLAKNSLQGDGESALVVGCGMGDDAVELEALGFAVTAFDVAETAIKYCKQRFSQAEPPSKVNFLQADLLQAQPQWQHQFDFVLEIFTVQALPPKYETESIQNIANFVAPNGQLLVIAEVPDQQEQPRTFDNGPPWLLNISHVESFISCGFKVEGQHIEKSFLSNRPKKPTSSTYITTFRKI